MQFIYFINLTKITATGHFEMPKITVDRNSRRLYQYPTFNKYTFSQNGTPAGTSDTRKSLLIAFLTISDQYATFQKDIFTK